jgi:peptide deformylase
MDTILLKIRTYGDPCLRKKSKVVKDVGPSERFLINAMIETMRSHKGIGLAAPQIGLNEQIFVVDLGDGPFVVINPQITKRTGSDIMEEGCLSIPDVLIKVKRADAITVVYTNENNRRVERKCSGLMAKVIQHETDHLNGKLIIDYASLPEKIKFRKKLTELQKSNKGSES